MLLLIEVNTVLMSKETTSKQWETTLTGSKACKARWVCVSVSVLLDLCRQRACGVIKHLFVSEGAPGGQSTSNYCILFYSILLLDSDTLQ